MTGQLRKNNLRPQEVTEGLRDLVKREQILTSLGRLGGFLDVGSRDRSSGQQRVRSDAEELETAEVIQNHLDYIQYETHNR